MGAIFYYGEGATAGGAVCVFDAATKTETKLCDLAGATAPMVRVRVVRLPAGAAFLNVFCADGRAFVYALAANGLSLASASPVATVDLSTLVPGGTSYASVNLSLNGVQVMTNLDIYAEVGAKASLTKCYSTTANGSGQIVCAFLCGRTRQQLRQRR